MRSEEDNNQFAIFRDLINRLHCRDLFRCISECIIPGSFSPKTAAAAVALGFLATLNANLLCLSLFLLQCQFSPFELDQTKACQYCCTTTFLGKEEGGAKYTSQLLYLKSTLSFIIGSTKHGAEV